ncbi:MAG: DUF2849 domain-containing protein [Paracoccaceae bacterium]|nr:DUF2849 domain-containing protein [Paracoccaceae bacterium]MDE2914823.1 DUF2849 domain-containing protein [Paracoccaceae bacterium]
MARPFTPKVLTANHLLDGDVVYLAPGSRLTRKLSEAMLIEDESTAKALLEAAEARSSVLVGPYLADAIRDSDGRPRSTHIRETLRADGPSIDIL